MNTEITILILCFVKLNSLKCYLKLIWFLGIHPSIYGTYFYGEPAHSPPPKKKHCK